MSTTACKLQRCNICGHVSVLVSGAMGRLSRAVQSGKWPNSAAERSLDASERVRTGSGATPTPKNRCKGR